MPHSSRRSRTSPNVWGGRAHALWDATARKTKTTTRNGAIDPRRLMVHRLTGRYAHRGDALHAAHRGRPADVMCGRRRSRLRRRELGDEFGELLGARAFAGADVVAARAAAGAEGFGEAE